MHSLPHPRSTLAHVCAPYCTDSGEGGGEGTPACGKQSVPTQDIASVHNYTYIHV